jgi:hypothetical protein
MGNLSLFQIEVELQELLTLRADAEAEGEMPEVLAGIDARIQEYFSREVRKVNSICAILRAFENAAAETRVEAERLFSRAKAFEAQEARLKDATLAAMKAHGVTKLETPENTLRIQRNGGIEKLEVPIPTNLPTSYQTITLEMPREAWNWLLWRGLWRGQELAVVKSEGYDNKRIREALKQQVPVPGAKLLPRGERLVVE